MSSLQDKVVIITGASSGIGAASAIHLAEYQPKLVLAARRVDKLKEVEIKCHEKGLPPEKILVVKCDVDKEDDLKDLVSSTIERFNKIDVLVNNAGGGIYRRMMETTLEDFDKMIRTNLRAPFYLSQLCIPYLIQTKGSIVNVSSISGQKSFPAAMPYCISKAGLDHFTSTLAVELAEKKVRVNSVNPGVIVTEFQSQAGMSSENYSKYLEKQNRLQPLGGAGDPLEVAKAIKFLASDESAFITGQLLFVDGGRHALSPV